MTAGRLQMDPAGVRAGARRLGHAGEDMVDRAHALSSALAAEGACWGGDEAGQKFGGDYAPAAGSISEAMDKVAEALQAIAKGLADQADSTEQQDNDTAAAFAKGH